MPELLTAGPLTWRDVPRAMRRQVWRAARLGRQADDTRVAIAAAEWSAGHSRRLAIVTVTARTVGVAAFVLAGLTVFKVIPPIIALRPASGSVRDYVGWWLTGLAMVSFHAGRWSNKRRRRTDELGELNGAG